MCFSGRTKRRQLILDLQHHPLSNVLQHADDLIVAQFGQVDAVHGLYVVAHVQLVTPEIDTQTGNYEKNRLDISALEKTINQDLCCRGYA